MRKLLRVLAAATSALAFATVWSVPNSVAYVSGPDGEVRYVGGKAAIERAAVPPITSASILDAGDLEFGLFVEIVMRSYETDAADQIVELIRNFYSGATPERLATAPRLVGDLLTTNLDSKIVDLALGEVRAQVAGSSVLSEQVSARILDDRLDLQLAQVIDERCFQEDLPEIIRIQLDCPPLETGAISAAVADGTVNGYQN